MKTARKTKPPAKSTPRDVAVSHQRSRSGQVRESSRRGYATTVAICYVESSALTAGLLEGEHAVMDSARRAIRRVTSTLTLAETARAIVRARVTGRINPDQEARAAQSLRAFVETTDLVPISIEVLMRVGRPFPVEPVRTLDAIHLATLEFLGEPPFVVTVLTRDARVRRNVLALGYRVA